MTLKIIGGEFKGRLLKTPKGGQTRPTTSMLRKAVFDILQPVIQEAFFLDLFSGSGAMGIEAISRGAKQAIFVDARREAIQCLKENLSLLNITTQAIVIQNDVFKALEKMTICFDIIYADPPYNRSELYLELLKYIDRSHLLKPSGILFLESPIPSPLSDLSMALTHLRPVSPRRYGTSEVHQFNAMCKFS